MQRIRLIVGLLVALVLVGGIAYASIPGPDGVIHGCYKTSNPATGAVIVVDSEESCPSGFTTLNWNQTGPQGPPGPTTTPVITTRTVNFDPQLLPDGTGSLALDTVACVEGSHAINGGVLSTLADPAWPGTGDRGGAQIAQGAGNEGWDREFEIPSPGDPTNFALPRPVDEGEGWRFRYWVDFPTDGIVFYPIDVTLYAICL